MDEALGFVAIDLGGRPYCVFEADWRNTQVGCPGHRPDRPYLRDAGDLRAAGTARSGALRRQRSPRLRSVVQGAWPGAGLGDGDRPAAPRRAFDQRCTVMQLETSVKVIRSGDWEQQPAVAHYSTGLIDGLLIERVIWAPAGAVAARRRYRRRLWRVTGISLLAVARRSNRREVFRRDGTALGYADGRVHADGHRRA